MAAILSRNAARSALRVGSRVRFLSQQPVPTNEAPTVKPEIEAKYRESKTCFLNFPVSKITFKTGPSFLKPEEPTPLMFFGDNKDPGLLHTTPPGPAMYSFVGEKGNLGKKRMYLSGTPTITDPADAEQEINILICTPLLQQYVEWLTEIQAKYVEHLVNNVGQYKKLKKFEKTPQLLPAMAQSIVKFQKDQNEERVPGTDFLPWRQKMYFKALKNDKPSMIFEMDKEMATKGYVRRHVSIYDVEGNDISTTPNGRVFSNDIVCVTTFLNSQLWQAGTNTGFKLKRNLRSVTVCEKAPFNKSASTFAFA